MEEPKSSDRVQIATCALLLEIAQADSEFDKTEQQRIVDILCGHYNFSRVDAHEVMELARQELEESIQLWRFTNLINENYSNDEKTDVIEMVWRVIYADDQLHGHEDHLIHRLANLLNLTHKQLINAKLRILKERSES